MMGSMLECYDNALYALMAPILVKVFLPTIDPLNALILAYGVYAVKFVAAFLGGYFIGRKGDTNGRKNALVFSVTGMACVTGLMGCLPDYNTAGFISIAILIALRIAQGFFIAGEYCGGVVFALEHAKRKHQGLTGGAYCAFSIIGILAASSLAWLVSTGAISWRIPYWIGFSTGIVALVLRRRAPESPEYKAQVSGTQTKGQPLGQLFKQHKRVILLVFGAGASFGALYNLSNVFLTALVPQITQFSLEEIYRLNTIFLFVYLVFLPIMGALGDRIGIRRIVFLGMLSNAVLAYPLFSLIKLNSWEALLLMKFMFSLVAACIMGPFYAWTKRLFRVGDRYTLLSISYPPSAELGGLTTAIALGLWKFAPSLWVPSAVLFSFGIVGLYCVWQSRRNYEEGLAHADRLARATQ